MTTAYTVTRDNIIATAMRLAGVVHGTVTPSATDVTNAAILLNTLVKEIEDIPEFSEFLAQWEKTVAVSANDTYAQLDAITESVYAAYYKKTSDSSLTPMKPMNIREVFERQATTAAAATTEIFYGVSNRQTGTHPTAGAISNRVMYFWPSIPAAGTVYYLPKQKIDIFDDASDVGDFPSPCYRYLIFQLAADCALLHGVSLEWYNALLAQATKSFEIIFRKQVKDIKTAESDNPKSTADKKR